MRYLASRKIHTRTSTAVVNALSCRAICYPICSDLILFLFGKYLCTFLLKLFFLLANVSKLDILSIGLSFCHGVFQLKNGIHVQERRSKSWRASIAPLSIFQLYCTTDFYFYFIIHISIPTFQHQS